MWCAIFIFWSGSNKKLLNFIFFRPFNFLITNQIVLMDADDGFYNM